MNASFRKKGFSLYIDKIIGNVVHECAEFMHREHCSGVLLINFENVKQVHVCIYFYDLELLRFLSSRTCKVIFMLKEIGKI